MNIISALLYNSMMEMDKRTEVSKFDSQSDGHIVIAPLSKTTREAIYKIQQLISSALPQECLWLPRGEQLHITFAHLISPDSDYNENKVDLWQTLEKEVKQSLSEMTNNHPPIDIAFQKVEAFRSTIIIKWDDDGSFARMRDEFTNLVSLPEATRRPPNIIHTTIARFKKEISFEEVQKVVADLKLGPIYEGVTSLDLIHEEKIFVQKHTVLKSYPLHSD